MFIAFLLCPCNCLLSFAVKSILSSPSPGCRSCVSLLERVRLHLQEEHSCVVSGKARLGAALVVSVCLPLFFLLFPTCSCHLNLKAFFLWWFVSREEPWFDLILIFFFFVCCLVKLELWKFSGKFSIYFWSSEILLKYLFFACSVGFSNLNTCLQLKEILLLLLELFSFFLPLTLETWSAYCIIHFVSL